MDFVYPGTSPALEEMVMRSPGIFISGQFVRNADLEDGALVKHLADGSVDRGDAQAR